MVITLLNTKVMEQRIMGNPYRVIRTNYSIYYIHRTGVAPSFFKRTLKSLIHL